jgi:hypothetical protein
MRTLEELDGFLSREMAWRKRELSAMRLLIDGAKKEQRATFIRAAMALLYAHWEGFVRAAGRAYLEYVSRQGLRYRELATPFLAIATRRRLHEASLTSRLDHHLALADFFIKGLNDKSTIPLNAVSTRSNLSSKVFKDIVLTLGLDFGVFITKQTLIDESLVAKRNSIAHGEYLAVDLDDYRSLSEDVVGLMDAFRNQIDNAAALRGFRR